MKIPNNYTRNECVLKNIVIDIQGEIKYYRERSSQVNGDFEGVCSILSDGITTLFFTITKMGQCEVMIYS